MALAVDGSVTATATGAASVSGSITTANTNDIIIVCVRVADAAPGTTPRTSGISGASLTWNSIKAVVYNITGNAAGQEISVWYAVAASTLSTQSITASVTGTTGTTALRITVFGVSGGDTATPLDTNASLPGFNSGGALTSIANASAITTDNANDMLIGYVGGESGLTLISRPASFSQVIATGSVNDVSQLVVAAVQTTQTYTWSWTGSQNAAVIVTAVRQAGSGGDILMAQAWM